MRDQRQSAWWCLPYSHTCIEILLCTLVTTLTSPAFALKKSTVDIATKTAPNGNWPAPGTFGVVRKHGDLGMSAFGHYSCSLDGSKSRSQTLGVYKKRNVTNSAYATITVLNKTGKLKGGESTGNPWVAALAKEGHWEGYGEAKVRQDPINSKKLDWDIGAEANQNAVGVAGWAKGNAKVKDPWLIEWYSPGPWTISAGYELLPGTALGLSGSSSTSAFEVSSSADFLSQWYLDFDIDGTPDQLFWSLNINTQSSTTSSTSTIDLILGPDVFLDNSKTELQIESELLSYFDSSGSFNLTDAYTIPAAYEVSTLGAGSLIVSGSDFAEAQVAGLTVPEPSSISLLLLGILGMFFMKHGKRTL